MNTNKGSILWVDDQHNHLIERVSRELSISIVQCMDVAQAIEAVKTTDFKAVVVDIIFKYPPYRLPDELIPLANEVGLEDHTTFKGVPFILWLMRRESFDGTIRIVSKLPNLIHEYPLLKDIAKSEKTYDVQSNIEIVSSLLESGRDGL